MDRQGVTLPRDTHFIDDLEGSQRVYKMGPAYGSMPAVPPKGAGFLAPFQGGSTHSIGNGGGARGIYSRRQF